MLAQPECHRVGRLAGHLLLVAQSATRGAQALRGRRVLLASGFTDLAGEFLHFGAQSLGLLEQESVLVIEADDLVDADRRDAAAGESCLYDIRFTAQLDEVNHGSSLPRGFERPRSNV